MTVLGPEALVANELVLPYDSTVTEARRNGWRKAFVWALVGLAISAVIAGVMYLVFRWNDPLILAFYGLFGVLNLYRIVNSALRWVLASRTLKRTPWGTTAVQVDRDGVGLGQQFVPWAEVTLLRARTPWWRKESWLELSHGDQRAKLRLDQVPAVASTIDQAVRTLSGGQVRVDTRQLDR